LSWEIISSDNSKSIARLFNQIDVYREKNESKKIDKLLKKIIRLVPKNREEWIIKSLAHEALKNFDEAVYCLEYVIQQNPKDAYAFMKLGKLFNSIYEFEKAQECHKKWLELDPNKTIIPDKKELRKKYARSLKINADFEKIRKEKTNNKKQGNPTYFL